MYCFARDLKDMDGNISEFNKLFSVMYAKRNITQEGHILGLVRVKCQQPQAWGVQGMRWLLNPRGRVCHRDRAPAQICWLQVLGPCHAFMAPVPCIPWAHSPPASCQFSPVADPALSQRAGTCCLSGPLSWVRTEGRGEQIGSRAKEVTKNCLL